MNRYTLAALSSAALLGLAACSDNEAVRDEDLVDREEEQTTETPDVVLPETLSISGSLAYRSRVALRPGFTAGIMVIDTTDDRPGEPVNETEIEINDQQPPIPFQITLDGDDLDPDNSYAVRGEIRDPSGEVRWASETDQAIDIRRASQQVGVMTLVRVDSEEDGETPVTGDDALMRFQCGDQELTLENTGPDSARLTWGAASFNVNRLGSEEGTRYEAAGGNVVFDTTDATATLTVAGQTFPVCSQINAG
ncbi:YbaY family lipoprotein [Maricaulis sp. CAU 1757]